MPFVPDPPHLQNKIEPHESYLMRAIRSAAQPFSEGSKGMMETALAGPMGAPSREPGGTLSEGINTSLGGVPRSVLDYPGAFAMGGAPATQTLEATRGINQGGVSTSGPMGFPSSIIDLIRNSSNEDPRALKPSGLSSILPSPSGIPARLAGQALGGVADFAGQLSPTPYSNPELYGKYMKEAQSKTAQLLRPPTSEYSDYLRYGKEHPAVEQMTKIMQRSGTYDEAIQNATSAIQQYGNAKRAILEKDNFDLDPEFPRVLKEQLPESMKERLNIPGEDVPFASNLKGTIKRTEAQEFKERIDDELSKFYLNARRGTLTPQMQQSLEPLAEYRSQLKEKILGGDKNLAALDSTYGGLKSGRDLLADRFAEAKVQPTGNIFSDLLNHMRLMVSGKPHVFVSEGIGKLFGSSLKGQTGAIENLVKKAGKYAPRS